MPNRFFWRNVCKGQSFQGQLWAVGIELGAASGSLVPPAEQEAGVVDVGVEVVVGEEKVVHLGWLETGLDQLEGGDRAAAEHQGLVADAQGVGAAKLELGGCGSAASQDKYLDHDWTLGLIMEATV